MSRTTTGATYPTINTVGALLPPDLLTRLANGELEHLAPGTYGLPDAFTLRQAAARAWELLLPTYRSFQTRLTALPETDPATVVTRDRWTTVLLRELGYDLTAVPNIQVEDDTFDVRHLDGHVPVHMLGWNVDLDKRAATNVRGASRTAPHSLIQELLNRTDKHLWAILTNGKRLRLLRDNIVMGRPAYIEFDLEGMFTGEQFADFAILYALAHATRLRSEQPADCILEQWRTTAINDGTRALEHLRDGVVEALKTLGTGFLEHPDNTAVRDLLRDHQGATDDYYRWLLRLVYRLIFLFVAEDRDLLHPEDTAPDIRRRYANYFSTQHLRELATRRRAGRHTDAWSALRLVFNALGNDGEANLGLPAYGSDLFNPGFIGTLNDAKISNERLLAAVRSLSQLPDRATGTLRPVDYKNLGSEELGSVYEALLEYVPTVLDDGSSFSLTVQGGNARKTSGSYYTATELVELLLDETLDPVLDRASASQSPAEAILAITVCDPACGSGHFLVAAARRIARRLATARTGDPEPTPDAMREALREVVARCIYGVDLSDLAAELAKVSLWLESMTPGQPLAFLDAHIKVGNALVGATPALLAGNIPDVAFKPLHGDDDPCTVCHDAGVETCKHPKWSSIVKKSNKAQRDNAQAEQQSLLGLQQVYVNNESFAQALDKVEGLAGADIKDVRAQADAWRRAQADPHLQRAKQVADAWCAAFVWPLTREHARSAPTHEVLLTLQENPDLDPLRPTRLLISELARRHRFFHWHLEFPHIFTVGDDRANTGDTSGWSGGFTCLIGNPPWDKATFQTREFFTKHGRLDIADASSGAKRDKLIRELATSDPSLHQAYTTGLRDSLANIHFLLNSGRYPLTGSGIVNLYALFAETFRSLISQDGHAGIYTPTGLATDLGTSAFFANAFAESRVWSFYDFVNQGVFFPGVHAQFRFALSVFTGFATSKVSLAFVLRSLSELEEKRITLSPREVLLMNPNTGTLPVFGSSEDARIVLDKYRRYPVLANEVTGENPWGVSFGLMFNITTESASFLDLEELRDAPGMLPNTNGPGVLPLYEGKHMYFYDHRFSSSIDTIPDKPREVTDKEHADSQFEVVTRFYIGQSRVHAFLDGKQSRDWMLGFRKITNPGNERTFVPCVLPVGGAGDSLPLIFPDEAHSIVGLQATLGSIAFDYISRQKISGSNMNNFFVKQFPCPEPEVFDEPSDWDPTLSRHDWLLPRVLELTYTSESLRAYAEDLGDEAGPFTWNADRRAILQAEIDAALFHILGYTAEDTRYVLDTFRVLASNETRTYGEYRTKRLVTEIYESMAEARKRGTSYESPLDPAPGEGPRHRVSRP